MYTILLSGYAIVRYNDVREKDTKQFLIFVAKTIGLATIAVFISSYQLFADILQYTESPRVGGEASFFAKLQKQPMFGLADPFLRFTTVFRTFGSDMLGTGSNFRGWQNYLEAPLFYCGIFSLVTFPQFFISLNTRQKYFYGTLTFVLCLPILFPYFRYAFWAFSGDYFRTFSLVIILFMLIFSARAVTFIEREGKLNKLVLVVTVLFLLILLYSPAGQFKAGINTGLRSFVTFLLLAYAGLLLGVSGATVPDEGEILLDGQRIQFKSPIDARKAGIETVYQDLAVAPAMTIAENLFLGRELRRPGLLGSALRMLDKKKMLEESVARMAELKVGIRSMTQAVETLSGGQRQCVAVARAAAFARHVVIMDEPTAALGVKEGNMVLELIRRVRDKGLPVILISHNMPHVFEIADRIHIARLGKRAAVVNPKKISMSDTVAVMTGAMAASDLPAECLA